MGNAVEMEKFGTGLDKAGVCRNVLVRQDGGKKKVEVALNKLKDSWPRTISCRMAHPAGTHSATVATRAVLRSPVRGECTADPPWRSDCCLCYKVALHLTVSKLGQQEQEKDTTAQCILPIISSTLDVVKPMKLRRPQQRREQILTIWPVGVRG